MPKSTETYVTTPNQSIKAIDGTQFAFRRLGPTQQPPLILLNHLSGNLDTWDPQLIDNLAQRRHVITFDYRGVGLSSGRAATTTSELAQDALDFIRALGFDQVDILGFSMGGMVAQQLVADSPQLVRRLILAGTGPRGGYGIENVTRISDAATIKAVLTLTDVKTYLFFTNTANGRKKAKEFVRRIKMRHTERDRMIHLGAYRKQLRAICAWGLASTTDLTTITQPALVVNGEADKMVPIDNSYALAKQIPNSSLIVYPDAGHGGIFQFADAFSERALVFLETATPAK